MSRESRVEESGYVVRSQQVVHLMKIQKNLIANTVGRLVEGMGIFLPIPFYLRVLGWESYGVIGFFSTLCMLAQIFDFGMGITFNRECARLSKDMTKAGEKTLADLIRTVEWGYCLLGVAVVVGGYFLSPLIAKGLDPQVLTLSQLQRSIQLLFFALAPFLLGILYSNGLIGAGLHLEFNLIKSLLTIARVITSVCILWKFPRLELFFLIQIPFLFFQDIIFRRLLVARLKIRARGCFNYELLRSLKSFALEVSGGGVLAALIVQADKLISSYMLPLAEYGHYMTYAALTSAIPFLCQPVFFSFFPLLTRLHESEEFERGERKFILGAAIIALISVPLAVLFAGFPHDVLCLISRESSSESLNGATAFALLGLGQGAGVLMIMPLVAQLASKWPSFERKKNIVWITLSIPITMLLTKKYGLIGAAGSMFVTNVLGCTISMAVFFHYLMCGVRWQWVTRCVAAPWVIAAALCALMKPALAAFNAAPLVRLVLSYGAFVLGISFYYLNELRALVAREEVG